MNDSGVFIKYLRTLGFDVTNDIFAGNAWYFRNSLVRANYNDLKNGIHETTEYLEAAFPNRAAPRSIAAKVISLMDVKCFSMEE